MYSSPFRIWNCSGRIPSPPLALFIVMLPRPTWLHTPGCQALGEWPHHQWLSGSLRAFLYSSEYSCRIFLISSASVHLLSHVRLFATSWTAARQASLSITNSWSLLRLMPIESVMPSSHLILCRPLFLLPPIPPSIRVFSNESTLRMRWLKYWSFSFSISPSNGHPGLISWLDLFAVQGTLKSLLQHHSSKASVRSLLFLSFIYCIHVCMKCFLDISSFLKEISSLSHSIVSLYFFALFT